MSKETQQAIRFLIMIGFTLIIMPILLVRATTRFILVSSFTIVGQRKKFNAFETYASWLWYKYDLRCYGVFNNSFAVYGTQKDKDDGWPWILQIFLTFIQATIRLFPGQKDFSLLIPMSVSFQGKTLGLVFASYITQEEFKDNPYLAVKVVEHMRYLMPGCASYAAAGQMGSWLNQSKDVVLERDSWEVLWERGKYYLSLPCLAISARNSGKALEKFELAPKKASYKVDKPITTGHFGTLYTMVKGTIALTEKYCSKEEFSEKSIAVLGGVGYTGGALVRQIAPLYEKVYAIDTSVKEEHIHPDFDNVIVTGNKDQVSECEFVIVLTPRGNDIEEYIEWIRPDAKIGFDTHPGASYRVLKALKDAKTIGGVCNLKVHQIKMVNIKQPLTFWPALPGYKSHDVIGCFQQGSAYVNCPEIAFLEYDEDLSHQEKIDIYFQKAQEQGFVPDIRPPLRSKGLFEDGFQKVPKRKGPIFSIPEL